MPTKGASGRESREPQQTVEDNPPAGAKPGETGDMDSAVAAATRTGSQSSPSENASLGPAHLAQLCGSGLDATLRGRTGLPRSISRRGGLIVQVGVERRLGELIPTLEDRDALTVFQEKGVSGDLALSPGATEEG